jgi:hypothetical protein
MAVVTGFSNSYILAPPSSPHHLQKVGICWVEMKSMLKIILPQTAVTGHQYVLHEKMTKIYLNC